MKYTALGISYAFCWGFGVSLSKLALSEISAATLLTIQLISSLLFLNTIYFFKNGRLSFSCKSWRQGMAGLFEPALAYIAGTIGLSLTTAINASLIGSTEVILTILFAALLLGEKLSPMKLILAGVSLCGVFILIGEDFQSGANSSFVGELLVFLGILFAVGYALVSKAQVSRNNPLELIISQQLVGTVATVFCFGIFFTIHPSYEVSTIGIPLHFWLLAIVSGIMQYSLAFLLYLTALQTLPVSLAAFYIGLIPVFGVVSAILLLGEIPSLFQWVGAVLIIISSYFANRLEVA